MIMASVHEGVHHFMHSVDNAYWLILILSGVIAAILKVLNVHHVIYEVLGFFFTRKFEKAKKNHKYAIVIPARNEENVIGNLIDSIKKQDYPSELLTIFVVADNCTDNTAQIARELGAICYEHNNPNERTKGFGLRYLFDRIAEDYGVESFEGYFIFDSDNLLKKDYITRMNESFDAGEKIITSYRATKNFTESWISSTYALHWLRSIRSNHRARALLRLATNIQGTGFLFASEIVKNGWKYTSLTEDRALTADCVVEGYEISYNHDAIFYDEQPTSIKVALRQRTRWSKGHLQAFRESGFGLFKNIFIDNNTKREDYETKKDYLWATIRHRWMSFDTFSQLVPKNILSIFSWILKSIIFYPCVRFCLGYSEQTVFNAVDPITKLVVFIFGQKFVDCYPGWGAYFAALGLVIFWRLWYRITSYIVKIIEAVYLFFIERKRTVRIPRAKKVLYCFTWPIFDIIGRYTQYVALFMKVEWKPIPHDSKINIDDIKED